MKLIDQLLNRITMYRLVVYGLRLIVAVAFLAAFFGRLPFSLLAMAVSLLVVVGSHYLTDVILGKIWQLPRNRESWLITGLILFLILRPTLEPSGLVALAVAGVIASGSKFILNWKGKHIFNPAAFAAAVLSLSAVYPASWWVGTSALWPVTLAVGLAVARKIRRLSLVFTFMSVSLLVQLALFWLQGQHGLNGLDKVVLASPFIFLATIMLTEPATMPSRQHERLLFAAGVAVLYTTGLRIGAVNILPEVALLIGNLFAFAVSPKYRLRLTLKETQKISDRVYNYVFQPDRPFSYLPGQYMEWTLGGVPPDSRGNRRAFTLASSPTESEVCLGVKFYEPSSQFKTTLKQLRTGDQIFASQLSGDFTLPARGNQKLAFIAGGIGITPFRGMIKYLTDTNQTADIILVYIVPSAEELAYRRELKAAAAVDLRVVAVTTKPGERAAGFVSAKLDRKLLSKAVPDYAERLFYVSGSIGMVDATKAYLKQLGVARQRIKTDHFSGY